MSQQEFRKSVEQSFREAAYDVEMTPAELVIDGNPNWDFALFTLKATAVFIIVLLSIFAIGFTIGRATASPRNSFPAPAHSFDDRWLYLEPIDLAFNRIVDAEAEALRR